MQKMAGGITATQSLDSKKAPDELNKINNSGVDGVVISFLNFKDE